MTMTTMMTTEKMTADLHRFSRRGPEPVITERREIWMLGVSSPTGPLPHEQEEWTGSSEGGPDAAAAAYASYHDGGGDKNDGVCCYCCCSELDQADWFLAGHL